MNQPIDKNILTHKEEDKKLAFNKPPAKNNIEPIPITLMAIRDALNKAMQFFP
jgi:hypothetical protein